MRVVRAILHTIGWRLKKQARISFSAYIKGAGNLEVGHRAKVHGGVSIDAGRGGRVSLGANTTVNREAVLVGGRGGIRLGDHAEINSQSFLDGSGGIDIASGVLIGPGVKIISYRHLFEGRAPIRTQATVGAPISIAKDVWIGANATILGGITIGEGAVIGAGAVVTRNIPDWAVAVGAPARVIRYR